MKAIALRHKITKFKREKLNNHVNKILWYARINSSM